MSPQFCILGVTNVGKSTLLSSLNKEEFATVEVGKEMRRRYPAEFFKGKAAMQETEDEAFEIFTEQYAAAGEKPVVIDGQPRQVSQIDRVLKVLKYPFFILLHAPEEELKHRIHKRDKDTEWASLSERRLDADRIQLYDVLAELMLRRYYVKPFSTTYYLWKTEVKAYMRNIIHGR